MANKSSKSSTSQAKPSPKKPPNKLLLPVKVWLTKHTRLLRYAAMFLFACLSIWCLVQAVVWIRAAPKRQTLARIQAAGGDYRPNPQGEVDSIWLEGPAVTDASLADLARDLPRLRQLVRVQLKATAVTGAGLEGFRGLPGVRQLDLQDSAVTDEGLIPVGTLSGLVSLNLAGTRITDAGLAHLAQLPNLRILDLSRTSVGDAGLRQLAALKSLKSLHASRTRVTPAGAQSLKSLLGTISIALE